MASAQTPKLPDRRRLLKGATLAGLVGSAGPAMAAPATPRLPPAPVPGGVTHAMRPCRFGAMHFRYAQPVAPSHKAPVLCLHASPGSGVGLSNFLPLMGADRLTIAADNPGFGLSDRPPTHSTIPDFAAAMSDLIDALGLKSVDLVGSHTGSATAVELAHQRPDVVRRLVLHSAPIFTPQDIADYEAKLAGSVPASLDEAAARLPDLWRKFSLFRAELGDEAAWQLFWEMNRDPTHMGWGHDAAFAYDFAKTIRLLRQPILVLNPKEGLSAMTERARGVAPNIRVEDLPWSGRLFSANAADIAPIIRAHFDA